MYAILLYARGGYRRVLGERRSEHVECVATTEEQEEISRPVAAFTITKQRSLEETRFGSRRFGRLTFRQACISEANHEDMDSLFPFLTKWEAHIIQLNFFLVQ